MAHCGTPDRAIKSQSSIFTLGQGWGVGYVVHSDLSANCFLNDLISAIDQRSYNS